MTLFYRQQYELTLTAPTKTSWAAMGGRAFAREAKERDVAREPLTVIFAAPLPTAFTTALRAAGLRLSWLPPRRY